MNCFSLRLLIALLAFALVPASSASASFSRGVGAPLFGVSRGGGLFGGKDDDGSNKGDTAVSATGEKKLYPAMNQQEVEDWLEHIPVFAVTDSNGAGVVLKPDDDSSVFYFFLNPLAANATLTQLKSVNEGMDLKVSAFSLGKIWFKLLNGDADREVLVSSVCRFLYQKVKLGGASFKNLQFISIHITVVSHFLSCVSVEETWGR